jgi:hypothetical protein
MGLISRAVFKGERDRALAPRGGRTNLEAIAIGELVTKVINSTPPVKAAIGGKTARLWLTAAADSAWEVSFGSASKSNPNAVVPTWSAQVMAERSMVGQTSQVTVLMTDHTLMNKGHLIGARDYDNFRDALFAEIRAKDESFTVA